MLLKSFHEYIIQLVNKGNNYSNEASTILNIVDRTYRYFTFPLIHFSLSIVNWSSVIYLLITSVSSYLNLLLYSLPFIDSWIHLFIQQISKCFLMWLIKILMYFSKEILKVCVKSLASPYEYLYNKNGNVDLSKRAGHIWFLFITITFAYRFCILTSLIIITTFMKITCGVLSFEWCPHQPSVCYPGYDIVSRQRQYCMSEKPLPQFLLLTNSFEVA